MNDDEFQAMQEEHVQKADLAAAIEDAKALGLDADQIMADSREGYKNLQKLNYSHSTLKKPLVGKNILNQTGIFSDRHGMIQALRNAVKRAKDES